eukprot:10647286-Heterocapsa_arctica.AAC.1
MGGRLNRESCRRLERSRRLGCSSRRSEGQSSLMGDLVPTRILVGTGGHQPGLGGLGKVVWAPRSASGPRSLEQAIINNYEQ